MSYINSKTINHEVIYSYTLLYGFNQQLTIPFVLTKRQAHSSIDIFGK